MASQNTDLIESVGMECTKLSGNVAREAKKPYEIMRISLEEIASDKHIVLVDSCGFYN